MQVNRNVSTCWCTVHQLLTVFPEISANELEIAALSVIPGPTLDSHEKELGQCEHWAIMCVQPAGSVGSHHSV